MQCSVSWVLPFFSAHFFPFDLRTWTHIDSLAALSSITSEPQISDPFATETTTAVTTATTEIATTSATTTTVTAAATTASEVDLFGG